ncbi:MAG: pilus assembly protein PilM, partial [Actinomycetota bacterium]
MVGLAFDDAEITGVEFRRAGVRREAAVLRAGKMALTPGVVEDGEIVDAPAFSSALRRLWRQYRLRTRNVVFGLDGRTTVIRGVELPALEPDELAQAAAYEIGELLSFPLDQAVVSTIEVGRLQSPDGEERVRATTLAVHQNSLLTLHQAVRRAGLRLRSIELLASSLIAAIEDSATERGVDPSAPGAPEGAAAESTVVVDAGGETGDDAAVAVRPAEPDDRLSAIVHVTSTMTLMALCDRRGLVFSRIVTAGVSDGETSLSDELEMELARLSGYAEGQPGAAGTDRSPEAAGTGTVVEGVRRTLEYHRNELDPRPVDCVIVCGPQSGATGLVGALARSVPDARVIHHRFAGFLPEFDGACAFDGAPELDGEPSLDRPTSVDVSDFDAATCIAIAATRSTDEYRRFDLRPQVILDQRADRRRIAVGALAAVLLAPVLIADGLAERGAIADEAAQAEAADLAVEALLGELIGFDSDQELSVEAARATERV